MKRKTPTKTKTETKKVTNPHSLVCEGCGIVGTFKDADEAFNLGWDGPPHFTQFVTCPNCSIADVMKKQQAARPLKGMTLKELQAAAEAITRAGRVRANITEKPDG